MSKLNLTKKTKFIFPKIGFSVDTHREIANMLLQPVTQMINHCPVIKTFELKSEKVMEHSLANKKIVNDKIGTFAMECFMHDLCRRNYCMISV